jgi:hypothetical protein
MYGSYFTLNTGFKEEHFPYDQHSYCKGRRKADFSNNFVLGYATPPFKV